MQTGGTGNQPVPAPQNALERTWGQSKNHRIAQRVGRYRERLCRYFARLAVSTKRSDPVDGATLSGTVELMAEVTGRVTPVPGHYL